MDTNEIIKRRLSEINEQYGRVLKRLEGLNQTIIELQEYASGIISTKDFTNIPNRLSNAAWRKRAAEMIKELTKINRSTYPSFDSVLVSIYKKLRDVYGIVLDQLRKDFRCNYNTLRYPSAFEAISDNDQVRDIFDSILLDLFPDNYFVDTVLECVEHGEDNSLESADQASHETIIKIIEPLAVLRNDSSPEYQETFKEVCAFMDCSWKNLRTRYINRFGADSAPSREKIILSNNNVMRKFKNAVRIQLEFYRDV